MLNLPPILAHLLEIAVLILLSGVSTGAGLRVLRFLRLYSLLNGGERLVFGLALGYGVLGLLMLAMGVLGVIYLPVGLAVLMGLGVVAFRPLANEVRSVAPAVREAVRAVQSPFAAFLAIIVIASLAAALAKAVVPVATQDDLMYHLALPRRYIEAHAIPFYADVTYSLFPQLMEMLYTWGLLLGSDRLSVLFAFSAGLAGPTAAALFAWRYLGNGQGIWRALPFLTAALFLTSPLIGYVLRAANTDLAQASFDFLGVYAFFVGVEGQGSGVGSGTANENSKLPTPDHRPPIPNMLILSGLCCGLAFSTKYYGFAIALALGVALLVAGLVYLRRGEFGTRAYVGTLVSFALPFALLSLPWLLRNWIAAGNPVWPLAGKLFGGAYWSAEASPEELLGKAPGLSLSNIWTGLEYIWLAIWRPPLEIDGQLHVVSLGPLLLPALLCLVAVPLSRWRPALRWLAYAAIAYWLLWAFLFSRTSVRYLSTFFLLAAPLGAYALTWLASKSRLGRLAVQGALAIALGVLAVESLLSAGPYLSTALATGRSAEKEYLARYMEDQPVIEYMSANLPMDARIYVWDGQPRGYYIPRPYVYARLVPLYSGFGSEPGRWRARLAELGITHILVHNRDVLAPGQPPETDPFAGAAKRFAERYFSPPLFVSGDYAVYELR